VSWTWRITWPLRLGTMAVVGEARTAKEGKAAVERALSVGDTAEGAIATVTSSRGTVFRAGTHSRKGTIVWRRNP
jgi:hypothetical protein